MKKNILLFVSLLCLQLSAFSQNKIYGVFESKTLFQVGLVEDSAGNQVKSILRFAPFANYTLQAHKDFKNTFGIYTGIGIKNVGFITKDTYDSTQRTVKSRAYCLSIPLGLKFGNIEDDKYVFISGEFLVQLDYKEKVFTDGDKSKRKSFYDNDINPFNYSGGVGFNYKGLIVGAEYTFNNFFSDKYRFQPDRANSSATYAGPSKSNILTFYFGFRTNLSAEKVAAPTPEKRLQQARVYQY